MISNVRRSLIALRAVVADLDSAHAGASIDLAVQEVETLSTAAKALAKRIGIAPTAERSRMRDVTTSINIKAVTALLAGMRENPDGRPIVCPSCRGVIRET